MHMVGPYAGEIMTPMAVALKCGATKKQFDETVGVHPSSSEEFVTMSNKVCAFPANLLTRYQREVVTPGL